MRGPHRALVGRATEEVVGEDGTAEVEVILDRPELFANVDPASGFIPAHVTGQVMARSEDHPPIALAIAVNGTIEAVTEPWKVPIRGREGFWSAIVPETAFRTGANTVEVFVITKVGSEVRPARPAPPR